MKKTLLWMLIVMSCPIMACAQSNLTAADSSFLARAKSILQLSPAQCSFADSLFSSKGLELKALETELYNVQRSNLSEDSIATYSSVLANRRKELRTTRDLELRLALTPEQQTIFDTQLKATKPQVLHFGVHNRADCVVCKSPSP